MSNLDVLSESPSTACSSRSTFRSTSDLPLASAFGDGIEAHDITLAGFGKQGTTPQPLAAVPQAVELIDDSNEVLENRRPKRARTGCLESVTR